jgi:hypothetical protein
MITLSFGFKKPEPNDKGPVVFPAIENNIQQLNDHDHNGTNSKKLTVTGIAALSQNISAAGWVSLGGGNYHQIFSFLPGFTYETTSLKFRDASTEEYIFLGLKKVSSISADVYTNNPVDIIVVYGF